MGAVTKDAAVATDRVAPKEVTDGLGAEEMPAPKPQDPEGDGLHDGGATTADVPGDVLGI